MKMTKVVEFVKMILPFGNI